MKNISKIYMIFGITLLVVAVVGSTLAYYVWNTSSEEETKIVTSIGSATVYFDGGSAIADAKLRPVESKEYGMIKNIKVSANKTGLKFNMYLDITSIDEKLKNESFRYAFYKSDTLVKEGNFSTDYLTNNTVSCSYNNTTHIELLINEEVLTTVSNYTLYVWIDGANYDNDIEMMNKTFNFKLHAEGTDALVKEGTIPDITQISDEMKSENNLSYKILSDYYYADKTDVLNNGITYHYDPEHSLMADIGSNVRYYGASPNNYVYFNCSDYTNQSSSACELWRIIGVFDGKVKLVRDTTIGSYSWDNKDTTTGAENGYGKNDWTDARLMKLLNPGYDSETIGGSLYYNAKSGTCYNSANNATKDCDFTSIGIKNSATRNLIQEVVYNIGGWNTNAVYSDFIYEKERGTTVYSGRPTTWTGKIGLMYPSDYGYAADFTKCKDASGNDLNIGSYNSDVNDYQCRKNNYLYKGAWEWLLIPNSGYSNSVWYVFSPGNVDRGNSAYNSRGVRPVVFLSTTQEIESGEGTKNSPYQLTVG